MLFGAKKIFMRYNKEPNAFKTTVAKIKKLWVAKVNIANIETFNNFIRIPTVRSAPPQGQSYENRRIMIRLDKEYKARKAVTFLLLQQFQRLTNTSTNAGESSGHSVIQRSHCKLMWKCGRGKKVFEAEFYS